MLSPPAVLSFGALLSAVSSVRAVAHTHPATANNNTCYDAQGNVIACPGSSVAEIIAVSVAGVVVISFIIALAYPRCKRRMKEKKEKASGSSQTYQKLDESEGIVDKTTVAEHNPDAPYDPPVNTLPYSYSSEYTPPEVTYTYNPPSQQPSNDAIPVQLSTAQRSSSAVNTPPSYEPPTSAPHPPV